MEKLLKKYDLSSKTEVEIQQLREELEVNQEKAQLKFNLVHNSQIVLISNKLLSQSNRKDKRKWYNKLTPGGSASQDTFQATSVEKHWKFYSDGTFVTDKCRKLGKWTVVGEKCKTSGSIQLELELTQKEGDYEFQALFVLDNKT